MSHDAALAIRALSIKRSCGPWAARHFAMKNKVLGLFRLVQQLEATKHF